MTLQDFQSLYNNLWDDVNEGTSPFLALDLSSVDTVLPVVELYLPNNTLRISNPSPLQTIDSVTLRASGTGVDSPYNNMPIVVDFVFQGPDNDQMYFTITGTARIMDGEAWTLSYGFPAFVDSIFDAVPLESDTKCYLYTQETLQNGEQLPAGIYIVGTINLVAMTGGFSNLLGEIPLQVEGYADMSANGSVISDLSLDGNRTANINLGIATLHTVEITLTYDVVEDPTDTTAYALPFFQIKGDFIFRSEGIDYDVPMFMRASNTSILRFGSDITELIQAGASALTNLANQLDIRNYLPTDISLDTLVQLTSVYAIFDSNLGAISNVGIEIKNRTPLVLADIGLSHKALTLDNILLTLMISSLSSGPQGIVAASADIILPDIGTLEMSVVFPDLTFSASIPDEAEIKVTDFIKLLVGSECGLPDLIINDFDLTVTKQAQVNVFDYDLSLNVLGTWWIGSSFLTVENFGLVLTSNPRYFILTGTMYVANIVLDLEAEYTGQDGEWIFTGGTLEGSPAIQVGYLVEQLAYYFSTEADVPAFISGMTISNIGTTFNTLTHDFTFHLEIHDVLYANGPTIDLKVDIDILKQNDGSYRKTFGGQLFLNTRTQQDSPEVKLAFDLVFSMHVNEYVLLATYTNLNGSPVHVRSLVSSLLGPDDSLVSAIPETLTFTLKDALFAWYMPDRTSDSSKCLFVLDMDDGINLSNLPLVGAQFPTNQTAKLAYKVMAASKNFLVSDLLFFNSLLPDASAKFPPAGTNQDGLPLTNNDIQVTSGASLATTFQLGPVHQTMNLPVGLNPNPTSENPGNLQNVQSDKPLPVQPLWFNVQKTFGPVYFGRIGMLYDNSLITFYLDASFNAGGLSIAVDGLSVSSPLTELSPSFDIKGLAVDYSAGGLEINGALLHQVVRENDVYNGTATIKLESFGLAVLGSYSYYDGHPSLFIYGVLSAPLGGIPAFFVTGLSAGFGYNRQLVLPPLAQMGQFPLVSEAMGTTHSAASLEAEMDSLSTYITPSVGNYWAAAGVRFTTYKIVDTFALLTVSAGDNLNLSINGMATAVTPPLATGSAVLAEIQMAVSAGIDLSAGFVQVSAQLTDNSFILSRDARLTGGFYFYAWYSGIHAMDFVLTVGGYNPNFSRPGHYPTAPRVGLNWRISSELSVKGDLYFALTPSMMMAGGNLAMTWLDNYIGASFNASVDFIIGWKPFTYSASAKIEVSAYLKGHSSHSVSASATLKIWGPDFSGSAKFDVFFTTVTITFGSAKKQSVQPIGWDEFKRSFIPDNALTFSISKGLVSKHSDNSDDGDNSDVFIVDPSNAEIMLDSNMPFYTYSVNGNTFFAPSRVAGIAPMGISASNLNTGLTLTGIDTALFDVTQVFKNVPTALWGHNLTPSLSDNAMISGALCGLIIKPKAAIRPDTTASIAANLFSYSLELASGSVTWEDDLSITSTSSERETLNEQIVNDSVAASRRYLMAVMHFSAPVNLTNEWADMFIDLPETIL